MSLLLSLVTSSGCVEESLSCSIVWRVGNLSYYASVEENRISCYIDISNPKCWSGVCKFLIFNMDNELYYST